MLPRETDPVVPLLVELFDSLTKTIGRAVERAIPAKPLAAPQQRSWLPNATSWVPRRGPEGYFGVERQESGGFSARIYPKTGRVTCGAWKTAKEAALARDRAVLFLGLSLPFNFPAKSRKLGPLAPLELRHEAMRRRAADTTVKKTSRFLHVIWNAGRKKWMAAVQFADGRTVHVGRFLDEEKAAETADRAYLHFFGEKAALNFPDRGLKAAPPEVLRREARATLKRTPRYSSKYAGVHRTKGRGRVGPRAWLSMIHVSRKERYHLGIWATEREAARAYDRALLYYRGEDPTRNFPAEKTLKPASAEELRYEARLLRKQKRTTSRFWGVYWDKRVGMFGAHITAGKVYKLGYFDHEEEAARAYDKEARALHGPKAKLNFHPTTGEPLYGRRVDL